MRIVHIGFQHSENDARILLKECISLAKVGHQVTYITANKNSANSKYEFNGVEIITLCSNEKNKLIRRFNYQKSTYKIAMSLNADIYHIHEPELMLLAIKIKNRGKKIIFDAHENYYKYNYGMNSSSHIFSKIKLKFISFLYWKIIEKSVDKCECIIAAGQDIARIYEKMGAKTIVLNNYPLFDDISCNLDNYLDRDPIFCYVGGVNEKRKIDALVNIFKEFSREKLIYAGPYNPEFQRIISNDNKNSTYIGIINRNEMDELYSKSIVGIILLSPDPNHYDIQSNKLFEYLMAGLPVICSNFPKWKEFIAENKCGFAVDPQNEDEIKKAIKYMSTNREEVLLMAINGRKAVIEKYNWYKEEVKLIDLYAELDRKME